MAKKTIRPAPRKRATRKAPAKRAGTQRRRNSTEARPEIAMPGVFGAEASSDPRGWRCAMCGQLMAPQGFLPRGEGSGRRGRVRKYDTDECRELAALIGDLESDGHDSTVDRLTRFVSARAGLPEVRLIIRKKLWKFTNQIPWNRGVENLRMKQKRGEVARATPEELVRRAEREEAKLVRLQRKREAHAREIAALERSYARAADRAVAEAIEFKRTRLAEADEDISVQATVAAQARQRAERAAR